MSTTMVVETTNNAVIGQKGVSTAWANPVALWLESSSLSGAGDDQIPETKVTGSQYWEGTLEGILAPKSRESALRMIHMRKWEMPTLFTGIAITFFAISGFFLLQSVLDLGIASLGPGVTAVLAAIFAKTGGTKK